MFRTALAKLTLGAALALALPAWSLAQHHGGGGHGGGGHGGGGHHEGGHGGGGAWHSGGGGWNGGAWNRGGTSFFFGLGFPYYGYGLYPYGYGYSPWYRYPRYYDDYGYDNAPGYYEYQSAYPPADNGYDATIDSTRVTAKVLLPSPDARLWVEDQEMNSGATRRQFVSPPLEEGRYVYNFRAQWQDNGRTMDEKRQVKVHPGDRITVDFTRPEK